MLQIFERGKAGVLSRDIDIGRQLPEDMLTAAVFGTLAYADGSTALEMLKAILGKEPIVLPLSVTALAVDLWPRASSVAEEGVIEPDILIDLFSGQKKLLRLIVEVKWNASLGPSQGIDQWQRFAGNANDTWHIFPVRDVARTEENLKRQDLLAQSRNKDPLLFTNWKHRRYCVSWYNIARSLRQFYEDVGSSLERAHLRRWVQGVLSILKFIGEKPFSGFHDQPRPMLERRVTGSRVFWVGPRVREFNWPESIDLSELRPVFFSGNVEV